MRVNVYAEELTSWLELVSVTAGNARAEFHGIRFYLESSPKLIPPLHPDDNSSAVTFWVRSGESGYKKGNEKMLASLLRRAASMLEGLE